MCLFVAYAYCVSIAQANKLLSTYRCCHFTKSFEFSRQAEKSTVASNAMNFVQNQSFFGTGSVFQERQLQKLFFCLKFDFTTIF